MIAEELAAKGQKGKILLVGGAVMVLIVGNRNSTRDIDGSLILPTCRSGLFSQLCYFSLSYSSNSCAVI